MIKKYKTKECSIYAIQLAQTKESVEEVLSYINPSGEIKNNAYEEAVEKGGIVIETLEGDMLASWNDYVIKGLKGEWYPCKPDVFAMKYELDEKKDEGSLGTLYDYNKNIISQTEKALSSSKIREKIKDIKMWILNNSNSYFMLLCNDRRDYTIFNLNNRNMDLFSKELKECLENRGSVYSIETTENKDAFEIWMNIDEEMYCYYFFPYDMGVIEI